MSRGPRVAPLLGAHCSVAGGLHHAIEQATSLRMDCVQVFTRNQRQWRSRPLGRDEIAVWGQTLETAGWSAGDRVVSHNSYLVNMASPDGTLWRRSVATQRRELERCETLGITRCVAHPGAHLGAAPEGRLTLDGRPSRDELRGLRRIARALDRLHRELPGYAVRVCLETTAGAGTTLGGDFRHLAIIRDLVGAPERVGFCFDTCHATAAGYDMTTTKTARETLHRFDDACGVAAIAAVHLNDSIGAVGSRRDRHTHIGDGACGRACFRTIVNQATLRGVPMILETPKGSTPKGTPWDTINLRRLRRLVDHGRS